jgi:hypothetical protein
MVHLPFQFNGSLHQINSNIRHVSPMALYLRLPPAGEIPPLMGGEEPTPGVGSTLLHLPLPILFFIFK